MLSSAKLKFPTQLPHTFYPHPTPIIQDTDNILIKLHPLYSNILKQHRPQCSTLAPRTLPAPQK